MAKGQKPRLVSQARQGDAGCLLVVEYRFRGRHPLTGRSAPSARKIYWGAGCGRAEAEAWPHSTYLSKEEVRKTHHAGRGRMATNAPASRDLLMSVVETVGQKLAWFSFEGRSPGRSIINTRAYGAIYHPRGDPNIFNKENGELPGGCRNGCIFCGLGASLYRIRRAGLNRCHHQRRQLPPHSVAIVLSLLGPRGPTSFDPYR